MDFDPDDFPLPPPPDFSFLSAFPYVRKDTVLSQPSPRARARTCGSTSTTASASTSRPLLPDEDTEGVLFNVARDIGRDLYR